MEPWVAEVSSALPKLDLRQAEPMKKHTTFRVGGPADYYACPTRDELPALLALAKKHRIPVTVIGNGSNLLVADAGVRGLVIEIGAAISEVSAEGTLLRAGAGALLSAAASAAAKAGLSGLEFAAGIPGSVGGGVTMNAGAYGGEMKDVLESVVLLTADGTQEVRTAESLALSYRHSSIPEEQAIVLYATFSLTPAPTEAIRERMEELRKKRVEKQPLSYPSAGSTFKRPEGHFAGKLIEDAGLRGYTVGGAQVSEKHCGFIINRGDATAADIRRLMQDVQERVQERFGVQLQPEVRTIGEF